jgi:hypothetical protein
MWACSTALCCLIFILALEVGYLFQENHLESAELHKFPVIRRPAVPFDQICTEMKTMNWEKIGMHFKLFTGQTANTVARVQCQDEEVELS